jgi:hypothetical protein
MLLCEAIYGRERGAQIVALIELSSGETCPCKQGRPCPLMPVDVEVPEQRVAPSPLLGMA